MNNDQAPADAPPRATQRPVVASALGRFAVGLFLLAFAAVTALFGPILVMASDNCFDGDARPICSLGGQQTVGTLPVAAGFVAGLLTFVGLSSRRSVGLVCLLAAVCLPALAWLVSLGIAGA
ncbi:hypothetical protein [Streptomyces lydicus]|uniref:hypothetical protein n=1 Tax=Streptomyces lydicus TaxID=47763 RepID=UPI00286FFCF1|nr:hypothetical protein [Streptomyces lydicus]